MCFETTCNKVTNDLYSNILSARPSTSTDQRLSKLDTRFSRFPRHFFGVLFEKSVKCCLAGSLYRSLGPFPLFKNTTLADKIQFTFSSSLCTISRSFWWHTFGENTDTYGCTKQNQQVSHVTICCVPVCLVRRSKLSFSCKGCLRCMEYCLWL